MLAHNELLLSQLDDIVDRIVCEGPVLVPGVGDGIVAMLPGWSRVCVLLGEIEDHFQEALCQNFVENYGRSLHSFFLRVTVVCLLEVQIKLADGHACAASDDLECLA